MTKAKCFLCLFILANMLFAGKLAVLPGHLTPQKMCMDDRQIYITEGPELFIYSLKNFKLIKRFGKRGEGPKEFKVRRNYTRGMHINVQTGNILIESIGRISLFTKKGEYIKMIKITAGDRFKPLGEIFVGYHSVKENDTRFSTVNFYDPNLNKIKRIYQAKSFVQDKERKITWKLFAGSWPDFIICRDKIVVLGPIREFKIDVFGKDGGFLFSIQKEYQQVSFSEKHQTEVLNWYKTNPSTSFEYDEWKRIIKFPDYFPAVRDLFTDDEKIYTRTFKETKQGAEFFVFDHQGKFIKKVFLPVVKSNLKGVYPYAYDSCPFAFRKGKFYRLIENEETEEWELHVHEVMNP